MFSLETITLGGVAIINMAIIWVLLTQSWRTVVNRYFIVAVTFVILWAVGTLMMVSGETSAVTDAGRILFLVAPMYTILALSLFAAIFPKANGRVFTPVNIFLTLLTVGFSVLIVLSPELLVPIIEHQAGYNHIVVDQLWYSLYTLYFNMAFLIAFAELMLHIRRSRGHQKQQLVYVFTGTFFAAVFSLATNLFLPIIGITSLLWLGPTWSLFYVVTVSVSIVKHQLFDVKLAAVRSFAYICVLLTLSLIYYLLAFLLSTLVIGAQTADAISVGPINIFMALVLAFTFQPIKRFFDKITNDIFYRDNYDSSEFYESLSNLLTSTVELRGLLERASRQIAMTFKAEQAMFFVYYENGREHHTSAGTAGHTRLPVHDAHMLDQLMITDPRSVYITDLIADDDIKCMLRSHKVALVMPLRQADKITGYALLGERLSGRYTKRDLHVLSTVSNELVIAIQNALSIHEVKELNATLQQRIDIATKELRSSNAQLKHLDEVKDEFMSMASHQLRTPLTSVKGYISMVVEGDVGKVSPQQQQLLTEAFKSSERMVRLISDFLDVSRLQTGKFVIEKAPFDLVDVVKQEVRDLELMAHAHELKLRLNIRAKGPMIVNADEQKIRQVIMNYIDNAIFYSSARSTIIINLEQVKHEAALTVVDTGIGVPEDVQARLFTKFFRAPNARQRRPDGTGIGLYLTRRVLNAHDGSIIFSSKEGKGSTFGFRLPIAKNTNLPEPAPGPTTVAKVKTKANK